MYLVCFFCICYVFIYFVFIIEGVSIQGLTTSFKFALIFIFFKNVPTNLKKYYMNIMLMHVTLMQNI
jgi:hypothetical protein